MTNKKGEGRSVETRPPRVDWVTGWSEVFGVLFGVEDTTTLTSELGTAHVFFGFTLMTVTAITYNHFEVPHPNREIKITDLGVATKVGYVHTRHLADRHRLDSPRRPSPVQEEL